MNEYKRLTTIDNPWDPDTQYPQWFAYNRNFYNVDCDAIVDQEVKLGYGFSEEEIDEAYEKAIKSIIEKDLLGIFKVLTKKEKVPDEFFGHEI